MKKGFHIKKYSIIFLFSVLLLFALWKIFLNKEEVLYIGLAGPMSGQYQQTGEEMRKGIQLYLDQFNSKGGLNGKKIELIPLDDQNKPELAKKQAHTFAEKEPVLLVLGHNLSSTSIKAGDVYKDYGLPAITASATADEVTEENSWYFRLTFSNSFQAQLLATYISKVLRHKNVMLITDIGDTWGKSIAHYFEEACDDLRLDIRHRWEFDSQRKDIERQIDDIINDIKEKESVGTIDSQAIFIATQSTQGADIVASLRYNEEQPRYTLFGADTFSTNKFIEQLKQDPVERIEPGYYSDGIYTISSFNPQISGQKAQVFKADFEKTFNVSPSWIAAGYYEAAEVAIKALEQAKVQGRLQTLKADRKKVRDALHEVERFSPLNRSDESVRLVTINQYRQQKYTPVWRQLQRLSDVKKNDALAKDLVDERTFQIGNNYFSQTNLVYTGIKINKIDELDIKAGTFNMDFYLWFRSKQGFNPAEIDFFNASKPIRFVTPEKEKGNKNKTALATSETEQETEKENSERFIEKEGTVYRLQRIDSTDNENKISGSQNMQEAVLVEQHSEENNIISRLYHVKGEFTTDFLPEFKKFGTHILGISLRNKTLTKDNVIYVTDSEGMKPTEGKSITEYLKTKAVVDTDSGWTVADTFFFQDSAAKQALGDIQYLKNQRQEKYSRFNAVIRIKDYALTAKGFIIGLSLSPIAKYAPWLTGIFGLLFFLLLNRKLEKKRYLLKTLWCLETVLGIFTLLSLQVTLIDLLKKFPDKRYFDIIMFFFHILWWFTPAIFINMALENFIWRPIEIKTERPIPNIVRVIASFLLYLLAFFAVISFVFDQKLTGLLATSSVAAMIIGLAVQMNISNIFSGLAINIERPFRIGDWVRISDNEGQIINMTWRTTRMLTRNGTMLSIPNTQASESLVENFSYPDESCIISLTLETVPIDVPDDIRQMLSEATLAVKNVLSDPPPFIQFKGQGDSSAIFTVHFNVTDYAGKNIYLSKVWDSIWTRLLEEGIELATPCRFVEVSSANQNNPPLVTLPPVQTNEV